jgi:hypothetical protein
MHVSILQLIGHFPGMGLARIAEENRMDDDRQHDEEDVEEIPAVATFTGESTGSGPNTATNIGRGGDVIVQDDVVYGRPVEGRDPVEGDRAPDQKGRIRERHDGEAENH